jgi:hypothetical protein
MENNYRPKNITSYVKFLNIMAKIYTNYSYNFTGRKIYGIYSSVNSSLSLLGPMLGIINGNVNICILSTHISV